MTSSSLPNDSRRDCDSCGNAPPAYAYSSDQRCRSSKSACGHHCNHSWSHDECCWCGMVWGEAGAQTQRVVVLSSGLKGVVDLPVDDRVVVTYDDGGTSGPIDHLGLLTLPDGRKL